MKQISVRQMQSMLKTNGYELSRQNGSHQIWSNGQNIISVPVVSLKSIIANRLIKENNLVNNY